MWQRHHLISRLVMAALVVGVAVSPALAQNSRRSKASLLAPGQTVNINTATAQEFTVLPGIGAKTAERIVEYRQKNGPFKKVEDLINVRGIGEKSFLRIKDHLTLGAARGEKPAPRVQEQR